LYLTGLCLPTLATLGQRSLVDGWRESLRDSDRSPAIDGRGLEQNSPLVAYARETAHDYLAGDRAAAERAFERLIRLQQSCGAIPAGWHGQAFRTPSVLATKYFLDAAVLRARLAFADGAGLPEQILAGDGRLQGVASGLQPLADRPAQVADVGCGSGRFLAHLAGRFPGFRWTGIDPSAQLLSALPAGIGRRSGGLPDLPATDGEFDGAFAVESLEHSLTPAAAVAELCRIVRPGGRVVIVDKHSAWQALSGHEPWERWFEPHEVLEWLSRHCDRVAAWPVGHGENQDPSGLFWCWSGRRAK
jgi:malonyl-CoA O-methyltransferase